MLMGMERVCKPFSLVAHIQKGNKNRKVSQIHQGWRMAKMNEPTNMKEYSGVTWRCRAGSELVLFKCFGSASETPPTFHLSLVELKMLHILRIV